MLHLRIKLHAFGSAIRKLLVPLTLSIIAFVLLAGPDQTVELYEALAQDVASTGQLHDILTDPVRAHAFSVMTLGTLSVGILSLTLWLAARTLVPTAPETDQQTRASALQVARILAALPVFAVGLGLLRAGHHGPNEQFSIGLRNLAADLKLPATFVIEWSAKLQSVQAFLIASGWIYLIVGVALIVGYWLCDRLLLRRQPLKINSACTIASLTGFLLVVLVTLVAPVAIWASVGTVCVVSIFLALVTIVGVQLFRYSAQLRLPALTALMFYYLALSALGFNDNHRLFDAVEEKGPVVVRRTDVQENFERWLGSRLDRAQFEEKRVPYPVYVVAAQGGGMYAAYHTAVGLSSLQDLCPAFAQHIFAISSVSGGSLGSATFRTALNREQVQPCRDKDRYVTTESVAKVLETDFLAPLVAYGLFPDFLQRFVPFPFSSLDRSRGLERSFIESASRVFPDRANLLRQPYVRHWDPAKQWPALIFNTTEVASGRQRIISPFTFLSSEIAFLPVWGGKDGVSPSLATAAVVSARFPWLTPSASFDERTAHVRLVDGAYFENSGVSTGHDLIRSLDIELKRLGLINKVRIFLLIFTMDETQTVDGGVDVFTDALDPIRTLLNTRDARAEAAIRRAEEELGAYGDIADQHKPRVRKFPLRPLGFPLPLGWQISSTTRLAIEMQVGERKRCTAASGGGGISKFPSDCVVQEIYEEINQGLM